MTLPSKEAELFVQEPPYTFTEPGTLLFMTGSPLSGKSTIAPLVAASIAGCSMQNMDIIRLVAQQLDGALPEHEQSAFLKFGSCDSYLAIGDGTYTPASLIDGYRSYAEAVCRPLSHIIPSLESQGASDVLFEGVQLLPSTISRYLTRNNALLVVTSTPELLEQHRRILFGSAASEMHERYATEKLVFIQDEILDQAGALSSERVQVAENTGKPAATAAHFLRLLQTAGFIEYGR